MAFVKKKILVTGAAGFIGGSVSKVLLEMGHEVVGVDNMNPYYDVNLKKQRLKNLAGYANFTFHLLELADKKKVADFFEQQSFSVVIHLAAQAGVRYSLTHPEAYIESNLVGFSHLLENCKEKHVGHLLYASSSSVYGGNQKLPFSESDIVDTPISLYAATKKSNELMAHAYAHLFGLPSTGLRFFTVYGPWGRPDMALFKFTEGILKSEPISVYNQGKMERDFTYIDDVVKAVITLMDFPPGNDNLVPYAIYNVGNNNPVDLMDFIHAIENACNKKAIINFEPLQPGDVPRTYADTQKLFEAIGWKPSTPIQEGVNAFVKWYCNYYHA